jgi:hypothetical protein
MIRRIVFIIATVLLTGTGVAASLAQDFDSRASLRAEMIYGEELAFDGSDLIPAPDVRRSIPLAFVLSAAIPGAGQAYNRQWIKSAIALGAEIGLAAAYLSFYERGDNARDGYIDFAHEHWSPARYAYWLNDYKRYLNEFDPNRPITRQDVTVPTGINFSDPGSWSAADQRAVREFFADIRGLEDFMYHHSTGASFAHRIPWFADQQYYELIGKYFHFATGWDDYYAATGPDGRPTWYVDGEPLPNIDPEQTDGMGNKIHVSDQFWWYAREHARANDLFRRARHVSTFWVLNHVVAAIDAAVFAKLHNDRLDARLEMSHDAFGGLQQGAVLTYRF